MLQKWSLFVYFNHIRFQLFFYSLCVKLFTVIFLSKSKQKLLRDFRSQFSISEISRFSSALSECSCIHIRRQDFDKDCRVRLRFGEIQCSIWWREDLRANFKTIFQIFHRPVWRTHAYRVIYWNGLHARPQAPLKLVKLLEFWAIWGLSASVWNRYLLPLCFYVCSH